MNLTERYNYRVGDRVRDKHTGREGRVTNIVQGAEGVLLVTVAVFAGGAVAAHYNYRLKPGSPANALERTTFVSPTAAKKATGPTEPGRGALSPSAKQAAEQNRNVNPVGQPGLFQARAQRDMAEEIAQRNANLGGLAGTVPFSIEENLARQKQLADNAAHQKQRIQELTKQARADGRIITIDENDPAFVGPKSPGATKLDARERMEKRGQKLPKNFWDENYGLVEIYDPTKVEKDLTNQKKYQALLRQSRPNPQRELWQNFKRVRMLLRLTPSRDLIDHAEEFLKIQRQIREALPDVTAQTAKNSLTDLLEELDELISEWRGDDLLGRFHQPLGVGEFGNRSGHYDTVIDDAEDFVGVKPTRYHLFDPENRKVAAKASRGAKARRRGFRGRAIQLAQKGGNRPARTAARMGNNILDQVFYHQGQTVRVTGLNGSRTPQGNVHTVNFEPVGRETVLYTSLDPKYYNLLLESAPETPAARADLFAQRKGLAEQLAKRVERSLGSLLVTNAEDLQDLRQTLYVKAAEFINSDPKLARFGNDRLIARALEHAERVSLSELHAGKRLNDGAAGDLILQDKDGNEFGGINDTKLHSTPGIDIRALEDLPDPGSIDEVLLRYGGHTPEEIAQLSPDARISRAHELAKKERLRKLYQEARDLKNIYPSRLYQGRMELERQQKLEALNQELEEISNQRPPKGLSDKQKEVWYDRLSQREDGIAAQIEKLRETNPAQNYRAQFEETLASKQAELSRLREQLAPYDLDQTPPPGLNAQERDRWYRKFNRERASIAAQVRVAETQVAGMEATQRAVQDFMRDRNEKLAKVLLEIEALSESSLEEAKAAAGFDTPPPPEPYAPQGHRRVVEHELNELEAVLERVNEESKAGRTHIALRENPSQFVLLKNGTYGLRLVDEGGNFYVHELVRSRHKMVMEEHRRLHGETFRMGQGYDRVALDSGARHASMEEFQKAVVLNEWERKQFQRQTQLLENQLVGESLRDQLEKPRALGVFQANGRAVGFAERGMIDAERVAKRTARMFEEGQKVVFLDIENDIDTKALQNVFAQQYQVKGGKFVALDRGIHLAVGEEWAKKTGLKASTEEELLKRTAGYLEKTKGSIVAGHNISHDVMGLAGRSEALGLTKSLATFQNAAQDRIADTLLASQAALPGRPEYSQQFLHQTLIGTQVQGGRIKKQIHYARQDILENVEIAQKLRDQHLPQIQEMLATPQGNLKPGEVFWDYTGNRIHGEAGRAYRFLGAVNGDAMERAGQKGVGFLAEPINFVSGQGTGETRLFQFNTPAVMAREMNARFRWGAEAGVETLMEQKTQDLARRRMRRILVAEKGAKTSLFEQLLVERERFLAAQNFASGTPMDEVLNGFISQHQKALAEGDSLAAYLAQETSAYVQTQFGDSRIVAQHMAMADFWNQEFKHHEKVVNHLEQFVKEAPDTARAAAMKKASTLWQEYISETAVDAEGGLAWGRLQNVAIDAYEQKVTFSFDGLGKKGIRIRDADTIASEMESLHSKALAGLAKEKDLATLKGWLGEDSDAFKFFQAAQATEDVNAINLALHTPQGAPIREAIWRNVISPGLEAGSVSDPYNPQRKGAVKAEAPENRLRIHALTADDAVKQLNEQGRSFAQTVVAEMPDELTPRPWEQSESAREYLTKLQDRYTSKSPGDLFQAMVDANPVFPDGQYVPENLKGQNILNAVRQVQTPQERESMVNLLRGVVDQLEDTDRMALRAGLRNIGPEWNDFVFGGNNEYFRARANRTPVVTAPAAVTKRHVGLHRLPGELADHLATHQGSYKAAGLIGLALGGMYLLGKAMTPPDVSQRVQEEDDQPPARGVTVEGYKQPMRLTVHVDGEHDSATHDDLLHSITTSVGNFFDQQAAKEHQTVVRDHRRGFNKQELLNLAADLIRR